MVFIDSNAVSSIFKHNPVTFGSATFVIAASRVGASTKISNVSFQFGEAGYCGGYYDNSYTGCFS
jgi:hypothetical protein